MKQVTSMAVYCVVLIHDASLHDELCISECGH